MFQIIYNLLKTVRFELIILKIIKYKRPNRMTNTYHDTI